MSTTVLPTLSLAPRQVDAWSVQVGGYGFELFVSSSVASFNEPSHAVNFAGYLFRQGRERPNDMTHLNEYRWLGSAGSADGREHSARQVMTLAASHLSSNWEGFLNEVIFFLPLRPAAPLRLLPLSAYSLMWDVLEELCEDLGMDMTPDLWVTHLDQDSPPHVHRTHATSRLSFYEAIEEGLRTGRLATPAGAMTPFVTSGP